MAKILLVEDDKDLANLIVNILTVERHGIDLVGDGRDALAHLRLSKYEVIILDWMLPTLSGMEVCREYRDKGGTTAILMLTSRGSPEEKESGLDAGADDYLTKPFNAKELSARI